MTEKNSLKEKIIKEMTIDYTNDLEKNLDLAKQFVMITKEGKIDVLVKENINGKDRILLYLIGKMYAKEAGLASSAEASNNELGSELKIKTGSLLPWLKELREANKLRQTKQGSSVYHSVQIDQIKDILKSIERKVKK